MQFGQELMLAGPNGFTLLHWAVLKKREVAVKILTKCKAPMKKDRNGNTPIHWASILGHDTILSTLLESLDNDSKKSLVLLQSDKIQRPLTISFRSINQTTRISHPCFCAACSRVRRTITASNHYWTLQTSFWPCIKTC